SSAVSKAVKRASERALASPLCVDLFFQRFQPAGSLGLWVFGYLGIRSWRLSQGAPLRHLLLELFDLFFQQRGDAALGRINTGLADAQSRGHLVHRPLFEDIAVEDLKLLGADPFFHPLQRGVEE